MDKGESNINLEIVPCRKAPRPVNHLEKRCLALRSAHLSIYLYVSLSKDPQGTQINWWTKKHRR